MLESTGVLTTDRYNRFGGQGYSTYYTQTDGVYELKNLAAGRHAICVYAQSGRVIQIFGVEVAAGKTTQVPDAVLPEKAQPAATNLKGTVKLPDGKAAAGASVMLYTAMRGHSASMNCDESGAFNFSNYQLESAPSRMMVKAAKCKMLVQDLTAPGVDLGAVNVVLERQEYGTLLVKGTDENGSPLSDALVGPQIRTNRSNYNQLSYKKVRTNDKGEARLSGLSAGSRELMLEHADYYLKEPLFAPVSAETETLVPVKLRRGHTIKGRVALPQGYSPAKVVVTLTSAKVSFTGLDEKGEFSFGSLPPGKYKLRAMAPELIARQEQEISIQAEQQAPIPATLEMVRKAGAAVDLGPAFAGYTANLLQGAVFDPDSAASGLVQATVDGTGRAEFWSAAPGPHRVELMPRTDNFSYMLQNDTIRTATASHIVGPLNLVEVKGFGEVENLPAVNLKVQPGTGSVQARLVADPVSVMGNSNLGNLTVRLSGPRANAQLHFSFPNEIARPAHLEPLIIGTPPADAKPAKTGGFLMQGVPAGEYKLFASLVLYQRSAKSQPEKTPEVQLTAFSLAEGQRLELGDVRLALPEQAVNALKQIEEPQIEPEDIIPVFQP